MEGDIEKAAQRPEYRVIGGNVVEKIGRRVRTLSAEEAATYLAGNPAPDDSTTPETPLAEEVGDKRIREGAYDVEKDPDGTLKFKFREDDNVKQFTFFGTSDTPIISEVGSAPEAAPTTPPTSPPEEPPHAESAAERNRREARRWSGMGPNGEPPPRGPYENAGVGRPGGPGGGRVGGEPPRGRGLNAAGVMANPPEQGDYTIDKRRYVKLKIKDIRTEILPNKRYAQLFGEMARALGNPDADNIIQRYKDNNPKPEDMTFLTYAAHEFSRAIKYGEEAGAMMTPKDADLIDLLARREDGQSFLDLKTHEGPHAPAVVKGAILHIAMFNPNGVEWLHAALAQMQKDRDTRRYKRVDERTNAQSEHLGLSRRDRDTMINYSTKRERRASERQLTEHLHEKAEKFRRAMDWAERFTPGLQLPGSSRHAAINAILDAERRMMPKDPSPLSPISWVMRRIDENLEDIIAFLKPTIGNPEVLSLISKEVLENKDAKLSIERGPQTFAEAQELARGKYSENSIEERARQDSNL